MDHPEFNDVAKTGLGQRSGNNRIDSGAEMASSLASSPTLESFSIEIFFHSFVSGVRETMR